MTQNKSFLLLKVFNLKEEIRNSYNMLLNTKTANTLINKFFKVKFFGQNIPQNLVNNIFIYRSDGSNDPDNTDDAKNVEMIKTYFRIKLSINKFVSDEQEIKRLLQESKYSSCSLILLIYCFKL